MAGYTPPCSPSGAHEYSIRIYALKAASGLPAASSVATNWAVFSAAVEQASKYADTAHPYAELTFTAAASRSLVSGALVIALVMAVSF